MKKAEWKKEIDALLSSGTITDSDIEDYISKHPEIRGRDVWHYISELTAPEDDEDRRLRLRHSRLPRQAPVHEISGDAGA